MLTAEWTRLESALVARRPDVIHALNPAASTATIIELERQLSAVLPSDYVECLKVHDGQAPDSAWLFEEGEFLSSHRVARRWKIWNDLWVAGEFDGVDAKVDPGVGNQWWSPGWIPFTYNGAGDHLCLDLTPAAGGAIGQIITVWHDDPERRVVAPSFSAWFSRFVNSQVGVN